MNMPAIHTDQLRRFSFEEFPVRGAIVRMDSVWQTIVDRNPLPVDALRVLGEASTAAVLMTSQIRFSGTLGVQLQSSGGLRLVLAQCTDDGRVRALCRMDEESEAPLIDGGILSINMEGHSHQQRYQGIVSVDDGNLPNALQRYFSQSEQLQTWLHLTVTDGRVAGLILQQMPTDGGQTVSRDPELDGDAWNRVLALGETLTDDELLNLPVEDILRRLFHQEKVRLQDGDALSFSCSCSRTRVADMLRSVGRDEIEAVLAERGSVEVTCEYCNQPYAFDAVDVAEVFSSTLPPSRPGRQNQ